MKLIRTITEMREAVQRVRKQGLGLGLVPTMGALHAGHLALMRKARQECDALAASIFINPTQFGPGEDLAVYPRPLEQDLELCRQEGVDLVFHPQPEEMFPPGYSTFVQVEGLSEGLCGAFRPGHFRGVATVVLKLLNIVRPQRAYFGEKDYQQLVIIRRLVKDLDLSVEIIGVPTVRDEDGLALSSRNAFLTPGERGKALSLRRALLAAKGAFEAGEKRGSALEEAIKKELQSPGIVIEYTEVVDAEDLHRLAEVKEHFLAAVAARVGKVRLIDNIIISAIGDRE
jgi:pantoate--beta-alanine ligase